MELQMGTNLAGVSLMFLYTLARTPATHTYMHTHTQACLRCTHYCQPFVLSLSLPLILFICHVQRTAPKRGMGGYSVLKEMLFHQKKKVVIPFSAGNAEAARQQHFKAAQKTSHETTLIFCI